jgi:hypothetical protein
MATKDTRVTEVPTQRKASYKVRKKLALAGLQAEGISIQGGFLYKDGGKNKPDLKLIQAFPVKGYGYAPRGELIGLILRRTIKGVKHTRLIPISDLRSPNKFAAVLATLGYAARPSSGGVSAIATYACCLAELRPYTVIDTEGLHWYSKQAQLRPIAVLGGKVYGGISGKVIPIIKAPPAYVKRGKLLEWQERLGELVQGNHAMVFMLSVGLAPFVAKIVGEPVSGWLVHSAGDARILGQLIRHLSGPPGQPSPWSAHSSGMDVLVRQARDRVITLEEHGEHGGALIRAAMHRLGARNDVADSGQNRFGASDAGASIFASCGAPLAQAGSQVPSRTHYESLLITMKMDEPYGVVTQLNGADDINAFVTKLDEVTQQHFGLASPAWIEALVDKFSKVQKQFPRMLLAYQQRLAGGQVALKSMTTIERQVLRHFAFIAVVGQLAMAVKVLKLEVHAPFKAADHLYRGWLTDWRGREVAKQAQPLQSLKAFFLEKSASLFFPLNNWDMPQSRVIAGYIKLHDTHGKLYLIGKKYFEEVLCKDCGADAMVKALRAADGLVSDSCGRVLSVRMPGVGQGNHNRVSFYAIKASVRFDSENPDDKDFVDADIPTVTGSVPSPGETNA